MKPYNKPYNPKDYQPAYNPHHGDIHTSNSLTLKIWAIISWIYTGVCVWKFPEILSALSTNSSLCALSFLLLLAGSCIGLVVNLFPNASLRWFRNRAVKKGKNLVSADLAHARFQNPTSALWILAAFSLTVLCVAEQAPTERVVNTNPQENYKHTQNGMDGAFIFLEWSVRFLLLAPLLTGNLLGALPKDSTPEDMPEELELQLEAELAEYNTKRQLKIASYGSKKGHKNGYKSEHQNNPPPQKNNPKEVSQKESESFNPKTAKHSQVFIDIGRRIRDTHRKQ